MNGDGLADLIVMATPPNSKSRSYVVFGKSDMSTIELSAVTAGTGGFFIDLRMASSAGDVNGDGLADLIVSDKYGSSSFVVFGQTGTGRIDLSAVAAGDGGFQIKSSPVMLAATTDLSAAGDVNGDGLADLILSGKNLVNGADSAYVIFGATNGAFHQTRVDQLGGDGDDVLSDGGVVKTLVAGAGNDTLAATAASVLYGGAGDDVFEVGSAMVTALQSPYGLGGNLSQLARIDGGSGMDTLRLSGSGQVIELSQISGSAMTVLSDARLESIEVIDMTGSGNNTLTLRPSDIVDMADMNVFNSSNGWGSLGASSQNHQLLIEGEAGDVINASGDWLDDGTLDKGGQTYRIYSSATSLAQMLVDTDISANLNVLRPVALSNIAAGVGGFVINGLDGLDPTLDPTDPTNQFARLFVSLSGSSVSGAGDVNGDGLADLIVGAGGLPSLFGLGGAYAKNSSYVVFGNTAGVNIEMTALGTNGFVVKGAGQNDMTGFSVSGGGDINGDGLADLIIGAPGGDHPNGRSYVIFGQTDSGDVDLSALGSRGFMINGFSQTSLGSVVSSAGDVNGDGLTDLVLSPSGLLNGYVSYVKNVVVFGKVGTATIDLPNLGSGGFVISAVGSASYGSQVSNAGDVNGDGLADLIVGLSKGGARAGSTYVVFGKTNSAEIDLAALGTGGFVINGQCQPDGSVPSNVNVSVSAAGDVNGDGLADLIVGDPYSDPLAGDAGGRSYVVFGQNASTAVNLSAVALGQGGFVINGHCAGEISGSAVSSAGDINGDGLADLVVLAGDSSLRHVNAGRAYVVFGKANGDPIDLSALVNGVGGFVIEGQNNGGVTSVDNAGDVNGDGLTDLIFGAPFTNGGAGRSYVVFGSTLGAFDQTTVDQMGTSNSDNLSDNATAQTLVAGAGNDTLAATAASVLYGGAGDDVFEISSAMITALQSPYGLGGNLTQLARIDGGSGLDTLKLMGSGQTLDLTQIAGSAMTPESDARLESIEVIDMTGSGDHTLKLLAKDVLDLSRFNVFATNGRTQLMVTGQAGDTLDLADATGTTGWTHGTATTLNNVLYDVWNHNTSLATVYVNQGVLVA